MNEAPSVSRLRHEALRRALGAGALPAPLAPVQILGSRFQIRSLLGRGAMGELWRAYDLKLRVDVALKTLRAELIQKTRALEALRREVRTAREVISPNVCRVFDLVELLLSMPRRYRHP
jgi:hypothetical protein